MEFDRHAHDAAAAQGAGDPRPAARAFEGAWPARDALPRNDFVDQLRRETRRSLRTASALSLVLYRLDAAPDRLSPPPERFLEALHCAKRETDIVGHVGDDLLAVLCPDTGSDGVRRFADRLRAHGGGLPAEATLATWPDPLFERLIDERRAPRPAADPARTLPAPTAYSLKRVLDVLGALLAIVLFSPLMLVTALLVALDSPGPVIFRQTRLGRGGQPFTFFKFRSMRVAADDAVHRAFVAKFVAGQPAAAGGAAPYKLQADPRVTRLGRVLRLTSIDELPQLFNVLRGEMSLVGPRPAIPYEIEHYQPWHLRRILTQKPGITGLWQVAGRSRVTFDEMVRMDLRYIRECSLWLDLTILLRTVVVVFNQKGAA